MSDTPETQEAVERWRQGKINIFDEMARLERERDEARDDCERLNRLLRHETALGQGEIDHWAALERERDEARGRVDRYRALTTDLAIQRNGAWEALREIAAADWKTSGELRGMARKALEAAK